MKRSLVFSLLLFVCATGAGVLVPIILVIVVKLGLVAVPGRAGPRGPQHFSSFDDALARLLFVDLVGSAVVVVSGLLSFLGFALTDFLGLSHQEGVVATGIARLRSAWERWSQAVPELGLLVIPGLSIATANGADLFAGISPSRKYQVYSSVVAFFLISAGVQRIRAFHRCLPDPFIDRVFAIVLSFSAIPLRLAKAGRRQFRRPFGKPEPKQACPVCEGKPDPLCDCSWGREP
jgi:hypothetical protein